MSIRTPIARVRGSGSARSGTGHFWHQRLTAVANVPLVPESPPPPRSVSPSRL